MSIFSPILGPNSPDHAFASGSVGNPVQRLVNAAEDLRKEIVKARKFGSPTRKKRLLDFQSEWKAMAEEIWGTAIEDAHDFSEAMRQEVIAAVAVQD